MNNYWLIFCKCNCLFQYTFMNIWSSILVVTNCINKISCLVLKTVLVVLTFSNVSLESWDWKVYLWYEDGVQRWCPVICDSRQYHCVKSFQMWSFFSFEHRKIRSEKYSIFGHFSQSVLELGLLTTLWFIFQVLFWQNLSDVMDVAISQLHISRFIPCVSVSVSTSCEEPEKNTHLFLV